MAIGTAGENEFVQGLLSGDTAWIGASDSVSEGDWEWVTGMSVDGRYSNWAAGQPDGGAAENCAFFTAAETAATKPLM